MTSVSISSPDELRLFFQEFIVIFSFFTSKLKVNMSISWAVNVEKPCVILRNFWAVTIFFKPWLAQFSFVVPSVLIPFHDVFVCIEVVLLEFIDKEALVIGQIVFVHEIRLPQTLN
jgi:hypothetical protein